MKRGDGWAEVCGTPDLIEVDDEGNPIEVEDDPKPEPEVTPEAN